MLLCIAEVKKRERKIGGFRKKIKIPEPDILQCAEYNQIKNKKNICKQKILEEYCVKIYEIDYFYEHYEEIRVDKKGRKLYTILNSCSFFWR